MPPGAASFGGGFVLIFCKSFFGPDRLQILFAFRVCCAQKNPKFCKARKVDAVRAWVVLARASMEMGATAASRAMGVSRGKARYWQSKAQDPDFHPGRHGGRRYSTLETPDQIALEWACFFMWKTEPGLTDAAGVLHLRDLGWTWLEQGAGAKRSQKVDFADWVARQDPSRLKYLDESHFENWDCSRWQWCRGPRGEQVTRARHMEWREIQDLLLAVGVRVVSVPAYFPEFMPCELVFQNVKRMSDNETEEEQHDGPELEEPENEGLRPYWRHSKKHRTHVMHVFWKKKSPTLLLRR
eukprot:g54121.t1